MSKIGDSIKSAILGALIDAGTDLARVLGPEFLAMVREFLKERQTPDGWTRRERATYIIGRLTVIRRRDREQVHRQDHRLPDRPRH